MTLSPVMRIRSQAVQQPEAQIVVQLRCPLERAVWRGSSVRVANRVYDRVKLPVELPLVHEVWISVVKQETEETDGRR